MSFCPAVSVVVPCYNAKPYIATTLRSVYEQMGFDLEVIVVDDGSSDGSAELVERDFPRVRVLRQRNAGVAVARNAGIQSATHSWIAFVDADDVWLPGKLQAQWEMLNRHSGARMCYTAWQVWAADSAEPDADLVLRVAAEAAGSRPGATGWIYPELLSDCVVWTSTVLMHRDLLLDLGGFDTGLRVGEDYDLWLRASRVTEILRVAKPLALYRQHSANLTKKLPVRNYKADVVERALERWGYTGPDGRRARRSIVDRGLARSWADFAGASLIGGQPSRARGAAWRSIRTSPLQLLGWVVLAKGLFATWTSGAGNATR